MDVAGIAELMRQPTEKMFEAMRAGETLQELDKDEINAEIKRLYNKSDKDLR